MPKTLSSRIDDGEIAQPHMAHLAEPLPLLPRQATGILAQARAEH